MAEIFIWIGTRTMRAMTIRNLPGDTHGALQQRAKLRGKSMQAEVRPILEKAVRPKAQAGLGTAPGGAVIRGDLSWRRRMNPLLIW